MIIGPASPAQPALQPGGMCRAAAWAAGAAVVGILLSGCGAPDASSANTAPLTTSAAATAEAPAPPSAESAGDATQRGVSSSPAATTPTAGSHPPILGGGVAPARLRVPAIEVHEDLIGLGLQENGAMEVPSDWDRAGWFTGGGKPGGPGPTVIAGHVDSPTAPAVFFRLTELEVGDSIVVTDAEGTVHEYAVYRVDDLPKDRFPTAEVFGALPTDELRLITCTGEFDQSTLSHADNRVVFAKPVDTLAGD